MIYLKQYIMVYHDISFLISYIIIDFSLNMYQIFDQNCVNFYQFWCQIFQNVFVQNESLFQCHMRIFFKYETISCRRNLLFFATFGNFVKEKIEKSNKKIQKLRKIVNFYDNLWSYI